MLGIGDNTFHGIDQNEDSVYSSKENDESDIESGNLISIPNCFKYIFYLSLLFISTISTQQSNWDKKFISVLLDFPHICEGNIL